MTGYYARDGFQMIRSVLSEADCMRFESDLQRILQEVGEGGMHGIRNLLQCAPAIRCHASGAPFLSIATEALGKKPRPVKGIYFDKTSEANWGVPWHQDLTIALAEQHAVVGFTNWTNKDGALHVQPPVSVLQDQVTLRIHLDDCEEADGALKVIPGSHRWGRLGPDRIRELRGQGNEVSCTARRGDVLLMSPLLLHASGKAMAPSRRRIVHVEYSAAVLPTPLEWFL
ncbi:MAG: phytanoyl-CoA dioxygenase family protein [Planctomycetota bacterium]|nr:phytanoyl-CoA dioxygenase family protein [Planctomycetota bacterium]